MSLIFGRACNLIVSPPPPAREGLDLSQFRIAFEVDQSDIETPNTVRIKVYNLSATTQQKVKGEFQQVALQAGYTYPNGLGIIFSGQIRQVLFGHESNVDAYTEIIASDGDYEYNNSIVNTTLAAGHTAQDRLNAIATAMNLPIGYQLDLPPAAAARGKVMFGLARDYARDLAKSVSASWSIQNGRLVMIAQTGYRPNEAVVLNSQTGLIGFPTQTPGGINVSCLLNPKIQIGTLVKIDPEDINEAPVATSGPLLYPTGTRLENAPGPNQIARISGSGFYKVIVVEHVGDTRAAPWYTNLVCLAVDPSNPPGSAVDPFYAGGFDPSLLPSTGP